MTRDELTPTQDITIDSLSAEFVQAQPIDRDWSDGWGEAWESADPHECEECGHIAIARAGFYRCENEDCENHDADIDTYDDGPMMNYAYPIGELSDDDLANLIDLPLTYITWRREFESDHELALSGGGMDLSWEICEAYIRLGYLPPHHFAALPAMAGRGSSARDKAIIAACRASVEHAQSMLGYPLRKLDEVESFAAREQERRTA